MHQVQPSTCEAHGHSAKVALCVVQVQAVPLKHQVQLGPGEVIRCIKEVEAQVVAAYSAAYHWEAPAVCVV